MPETPPWLASAIVRAMQTRDFKLFIDSGEINIVYVEGMDIDGTVNGDAPNKFNDLRCTIQFFGSEPKIIGAWEATTEPSKYWTEHRMNPAGAARIAFGQYTAWQTGVHRGNHEALVQRAPVMVYRDANEDFQRTGDRITTGLYGINQHWGYDLPKNDLGRSSAGCLVGRSTVGHIQFMRQVKTDPRWRVDREFMFTTTILRESDVIAAMGVAA